MPVNLSNYSLTQLKQLRARIEKEIARQQSTGKDALLKKLKRMAREHGLSLEDVLGGSPDSEKPKANDARRPAAPKTPVAVKYRHPSKMDLAWSGRGRKPRWVEAWLAHGGALDALATAAAKFDKKQQRVAKAAADSVTPTPTVAPVAAAEAEVAPAN
ncbi:H-NS family nucleoid-associated regulatory protein [Aromatoleum diolicum]|uniref:H-NS histone family protein n=1 Tax=Aromatoleum diolicum TaxID=75796 RepID=A0ABX1QAW0_9RHOO|nr:H-NS histone family protein [Aromatoleum diolicum]NMG74245.1 H-NS histone family protein [Aromatoleum diolicum]